ncbi:dipicolinate synthase subunit B [Kyrpidia spormannii]|uniref:Dipicolinate synthase subunit B n=2 Tax=Kyrpidia spormannii TaxID=2055160 RepID=A0A2K8N796_9BACL|nr:MULTISPECIES: dipicolinate synthase subunit B [Kyrpidia]ATY84975.1 dipicolinate synthase subunit B [Kyrpidia spormannii]MCL6574705.1 dipicolinate synthase subunit B [Kyrpidia sp.]CAB3392394.1 spore dipicolinate synthase subunit B [Kyrpidia spormannii]
MGVSSLELEGKTVGFAITGSHCTYDAVFPELVHFVEKGCRVVPIVSGTVSSTDTRFWEASSWLAKIEETTGTKVIDRIVDAEPLGPSKALDVLVIAPCTGNTLSRLANAITDSPVLMAAKATLRNDRPVVVAVSTNDGLGLNMVNLARLMATKNIFFVPFGQDDPDRKMNSLVARMDLLVPTVEAALEKRQLQPVLIERFRYH